MIKYIAFLRAINVGGKNLIKMEELKKQFISIGCKNVSTYIQSGNVLFESEISEEKLLVNQIEKRLHKKLSKDALVYLRKIEDLESIIKIDPFQKIKFNAPAKLYVTFLSQPLTSKLKIPLQAPKKDVEIVRIKDREIYCVALEINGSYGFPNLFIEKEFGIQATTRNWNTIIRLHELHKYQV